MDLNAICEHGGQRRKCPICERDEEIKRLRAHIFNGEELMAELVNGERNDKLLSWSRQWIAFNLGAEPDDVRHGLSASQHIPEKDDGHTG